MQAVGALDHPKIVRAHDAGEFQGRHYLVMEFVRGGDVGQLVAAHGPLPIAVACEIVRQAAVGLAHAHEAGLVHRDIKPSNLMLSESGVVKILDLGLALVQQGDGGNLTSTGIVMGTIDFMAPEQAGNTHDVDIRADLYSLGATLYKLLTGNAPLADPRNDTVVKKIMALATHAPAPISQARPEIPAPLATLIHRLLAKSPNERLASPAPREPQRE
jgi:serine/threonine protein kinase